MQKTKLTDIRQERLDKLKQLSALNQQPYPSFFNKKNTILGCRGLMGKTVSTAGRIISLRHHGKISFAFLQDDSGQIQLFFQQQKLDSIQKTILKLLDIGDILGVSGQIITTSTGEVSISVESLQLLTKPLRPLPSSWHGLNDQELRFRQRYLDTIMDQKVLQRFQLRSNLVKSIRDYLHQQNYIEIETPALQNLYGGTNARPFHTHLNALDIDMYLRIAVELYLKRAIVGGFDRVFEIAKDFRNEGMDQSHSPEFTMLELYEAYADYHRIMQLTEGMIKFCANSLFQKEELTVQGQIISLSGQWPKITMSDLVKQKIGLDYESHSQAEFLAYAQKHKLEVLPNMSKGMLMYTIFDHQITKDLISPIWVIDYPVEVSPLAKLHPSKLGFVERFEGYIGGVELCDGWSEINDPLDQRARFENEQKAMRQGKKDDAHPVDEEFIEALEHGMPPTGGIGIGIDRLTMFFTDTWSIREVQLYPLMRPKKSVKSSHDNPGSI